MATAIEKGGWVRSKRDVAGAKISPLVFDLASRWCAICRAVNRLYLEYPDMHANGYN